MLIKFINFLLVVSGLINKSYTHSALCKKGRRVIDLRVRELTISLTCKKQKSYMQSKHILKPYLLMPLNIIDVL